MRPRKIGPAFNFEIHTILIIEVYAIELSCFFSNFLQAFLEINLNINFFITNSMYDYLP